MLGSRRIKPEELPPSEDIKKLERRVKSQEKKLVQESGKLPQTKWLFEKTVLLHIYEDIYYHAGGREHEAILSVEDWKTV